jgi:putative nucleotidyltransferase with HDIG domain
MKAARNKTSILLPGCPVDIIKMFPGRLGFQVVHLLAALRLADEATYQHSLDVGLLASAIAQLFGFNEELAMIAGFTHDVGKLGIRPELLKKTVGWTAEDGEEMAQHAIFGYRLLEACRLDPIARITALHHRFQRNGYPKVLPWEGKTNKTEMMIARIIGIADRYNASHRPNDKFREEPLSEEEIMAKMFIMTDDAVSIAMIYFLYLHAADLSVR